MSSWCQWHKGRTLFLPASPLSFCIFLPSFFSFPFQFFFPFFPLSFLPTPSLSFRFHLLVTNKKQQILRGKLSGSKVLKLIVRYFLNGPCDILKYKVSLAQPLLHSFPALFVTGTWEICFAHWWVKTSFQMPFNLKPECRFLVLVGNDMKLHWILFFVH